MKQNHVRRPMARRALIEQRPWLLAGVVAACVYYFIWNNPVGGIWLISLKGAAVALLAMYAWRRGEGGDANLLVGALALSAAGTMVAELYFRAGWAAFALSHLVAATLYWRNRRARASFNQRSMAVALLVGTPVIAWLLTGAVSATIYAGILGIMAGAAWGSRFARRHVAAGVIALTLSDLLVFTRAGEFDTGELPELLAWPLYYAGLLMVATGVVQTLRSVK